MTLTESNAKPIATTVSHNIQANPNTTKRLLRALALTVPHQDIPTNVNSTEDCQRISDIYNQQVDATWRQLRSRYPTAVMAARELSSATARASTWTDALVTNAAQAYAPARLALVASLARRLVIDGLAVARGSLEHCRADLLEMDTRDDLHPLTSWDQLAAAGSTAASTPESG